MKPQSMTIKEWLVKGLSIGMKKKNITEKTISLVVSHQFESAIEAMKTNNSIEISGFCKFLFNDKKALRRYDKLLAQKKFFENVLSSDEFNAVKKRNAQAKLNTVLENIKALKPKLHEQA